MSKERSEIGNTKETPQLLPSSFVFTLLESSQRKSIVILKEDQEKQHVVQNADAHGIRICTKDQSRSFLFSRFEFCFFLNGYHIL